MSEQLSNLMASDSDSASETEPEPVANVNQETNVKQEKKPAGSFCLLFAQRSLADETFNFAQLQLP
jgi:hypothetical protein